MLLLAVAGCGTVANVTLSPMPGMSSEPSPVAPFGGVEKDLTTLRSIPYRVGGNPADYGPGFPLGLLANAGRDALLSACYFVDLPVSLVGDCVTLPLVLAGAFDKGPVVERTTGPSGIDLARPTSQQEATPPSVP